MAPYQVSGERLIFEWMAAEPDLDVHQALLAWLPELAADPVGVSASRSPRPGVPAYAARVPGTHTFVDYAVVEQFHTVLIVAITSGPSH